MEKTRTPDTSDRIGLYISAGLVAALGLAMLWSALQRVLEVAAGGAIPVTVALDAESTSLPLGPDGAPFPATVDSATVGVTDPAPATLFALYAEPIWIGVMMCAGLIVAALFFWRLAKGRAFTKGAANLAFAGAAILTLGWFVGGIFTNMTSNGALSAISDYTYDSVTFESGLAEPVGVLVLLALGMALTIGEKLQRDTEGLV